MELLDEFFYGVWYWYTSIKFRKILKLFYEIPLKKCVFFHLFNNECIIIAFLQKKTIII